MRVHDAWDGLRAAVRSAGLAGWLGAGLLLLAAWTQLAWVPDQQARTAQLASDARRLRHGLIEADAASHAQVGASPQRAAFANASQAWQSVWRALPDAASRVQLPATVLQAADRAGLRIQSVQYEGEEQPWARQGDQTLWRQRMSLPVQGSAVAVRAWLAQVLSEPALSVDALSLQREGPLADVVSAQVSLSLWWKQPVRPVATAATEVVR